MDRLEELHNKIPGIYIVTNVMTPEGTKIVVCWHHKTPKGLNRPCMVMDYDMDTAFRKALLLEEDLEEAEAQENES